jgi:hypothetical protein
MEQPMGFEYRLSVTSPDRAVIETMLESLPGARPAASGAGVDLGATTGGWPDASAPADDEGIYFLYYGSATGRATLGEIAAMMVDQFGSVTVEEI